MLSEFISAMKVMHGKSIFNNIKQIINSEHKPCSHVEFQLV